MDKKKLIIIILVFALLVLSAVLLTIKLFNLENETIKTSTENIIENSTVNNTIKNEVLNESINNTIQNDVNTNEIQNETNNTTNIEMPEETVEETTQENKTYEEKAVSIVKKIWKNEKDVYCSFEEIDSEGKYVVRVTKETRVLCWYAIDIETGEYTVKQNI